MAEISGPAVTLEDVEVRLQALLQVLPKGPPAWARHELTFGQLRLLFVLRQSGPVSIGQLADMLGVTDATASEFVDRLERRGLAIRSHRVDDRRVVESRLSDDGARLLAEIAGARREGLRRVLSVLTGDELVAFDNLLRIMAERLQAATQTTTPTEGGTRVIFETPPASPAEDAGGGPA